MIVTIDGPAGAGKSSIAREVADRLGFEFLDTGAMYRAVTYGAMQASVDLTDLVDLQRYAANVELHWKDNHVFLDGRNVTTEIRSPEVTASIRFVADPPAIREKLSDLQRRISAGRDMVTEGRDQGSEVFVDAECKIFLTASPEERARRRQTQLAESGQQVPFDDILIAQNKRDLEDRMRPIGRLRAASDAVTLSTDGMSPDEVLAAVLSIVHGKVSAAQVQDGAS